MYAENEATLTWRSGFYIDTPLVKKKEQSERGFSSLGKEREAYESVIAKGSVPHHNKSLFASV